MESVTNPKGFSVIELLMALVITGIVVALIGRLIVHGKVNASKIKAVYSEIQGLYNSFEFFRLENGCEDWSACSSVSFSKLIDRNLIASDKSIVFGTSYQLAVKGDDCLKISLNVGSSVYAEDIVKEIEDDGNDHIRAAHSGAVLNVIFWCPTIFRAATSTSCP